MQASDVIPGGVEVGTRSGRDPSDVVLLQPDVEPAAVHMDRDREVLCVPVPDDLNQLPLSRLTVMFMARGPCAEASAAYRECG
jgi:hypothetical protein